MSPSSTIPITAVSLLVENGQLPEYQSPTAPPSIIFAILFGTMTIFYIYHTITKVHGRRIAWLLLSTFAFSRFLAYSIHSVWAQGLVSKNLAISQGVFLNGGFFLSCEALFIFLTDWIVPLIPLNNNNSDALAIPTTSTIQTVTTSTFIITKNLQLADKNILFIPKLLLLPTASLLGAIGCAKYYSANDMDEFGISLNLLRASAVSFTILITFLVILITYYAIRYSDRIIQTKKAQLIAVLYFSASLLLLDAVYKVVRGFSVPTDVFAHARWVPYVFEAAPELILLTFLGLLGVTGIIHVQNSPSDQIPIRKLEEAPISEKRG